MIEDNISNIKFDFEKKTSKSWNRYLFEFILINIDETKVLKKSYEEDVFGSWFIELSEKRFVYDGKDFMLIKQKKKNNIWIEDSLINNEDLTYSSCMSLLNN